VLLLLLLLLLPGALNSAHCALALLHHLLLPTS
jgi:hypothetical protein